MSSRLTIGCTVGLRDSQGGYKYLKKHCEYKKKVNLPAVHYPVAVVVVVAERGRRQFEVVKIAQVILARPQQIT